MKQICVIKLGAMGDVVRTLPVLPAIKEKYPNSKITWITRENVANLFEGNSSVDNLITLPFKGDFEKFDVLYNFDIEEDATELAMKIESNEKYGFYSDGGYAAPFNMSAEYYLSTLFDDYTKKTNKKTYQEMMFDAAELEYKKQPSTIFLRDKEKKYQKEFILKNKLPSEKLIGINIGASDRWPSKVWHEDNLKEFVEKIHSKGYEVMFLGGLAEEEKLKSFVEYFSNKNILIYQNDPKNTLKEFVSILDLCYKLIVPDSLSLHLALALKKPTIGLFFCTSYNEVEDYGVLKKVISPMHADFFPEKMDQYSEELVKSISSKEVINFLERDDVRVVNAIIQKKNKFLVIKRKEGIHKGKWAFVGGVVEEGEEDDVALMREIKEEVGLKLKGISRKIADYEYFRPNGEKTLGISYLVDVENGEVKIDEKEISEFRWVGPEEFMELDFVEGLDEEMLQSIK